MKRKSTFWPAVLCAVLFSLTASRPVYGQAETGAIDGTVTDATGAVIPSGKVVVRSVATGAERIVSTNDRGYYNVSNLLPGLYWVVAEAPNLAKSERRVEVTVGSRNEVNLQLALGTTSTVVEVVGGRDSMLQVIETPQKAETIKVLYRSLLRSSGVEVVEPGE